jgi:CYTH domain-containing protein
MTAVEIERKFLVDPHLWHALEKPSGSMIIQGFLCRDDRKIIRIRSCGNTGYITIKTSPAGLERTEFEYEIPGDEALSLLRLVTGHTIEKIRYRIMDHEKLWEVDVFSGVNEGLVLAEIELSDPGEPFTKPDWAGEEVTGDQRYYNSYLSEFPYCSWQK